VNLETLACIDDSLEAVDRIAKIVRQLLDLGRAAATAPGDGEVTSVSRAVQQALGSARPSLRSSISVTTDLVDDLFVRGDEASLVQVLVNLLVNAGQAIPDSRDGHIVVRAIEENDTRIVVSVVDNGAGMSDETKRRLFEPFYTTKPFGQGTGLGLSLSLGIVQSLGGDVSVDSRPGETVMRLELPVATAPSPTSSGRLRAWDRRRTLLLIEDDERVRKALSRTLASKFELELVDGVEAALARLDQERFDVVLTDWKMPSGGGRRLYEEAVARRPDLAPWIIVMTGGGLSVDDRAFIERHAIQVLDKPLAVEGLLSAVRVVEKSVRAKRGAGTPVS
jgi:two-component system NtrC family sensor kinase